MKPAGFTLLEILVLLVVLGLLVAATSQGLRLGARLWNGERAALAGADDLVAGDGTLRRLIAGMEPGFDAPALVGTWQAMEFETELPLAALPTRRCRVRLLLDRGRGLVLRWVSDAHVAGAPAVAPVQNVLIAGVADLGLSYASADMPGRWLGEWRSQELPSLIRIHIGFNAADGRAWPDIIVHPRRQGAGAP
jgi:general secretion pathway protein J